MPLKHLPNHWSYLCQLNGVNKINQNQIEKVHRSQHKEEKIANQTRFKTYCSSTS